jgi:hypothetical protein
VSRATLSTPSKTKKEFSSRLRAVQSVADTVVAQVGTPEAREGKSRDRSRRKQDADATENLKQLRLNADQQKRKRENEKLAEVKAKSIAAEQSLPRAKNLLEQADSVELKAALLFHRRFCGITVNNYGKMDVRQLAAELIRVREEHTKQSAAASPAKSTAPRRQTRKRAEAERKERGKAAEQYQVSASRHSRAAKRHKNALDNLSGQP